MDWKASEPPRDFISDSQRHDEPGLDDESNLDNEVSFDNDCSLGHASLVHATIDHTILDYTTLDRITLVYISLNHTTVDNTTGDDGFQLDNLKDLGDEATKSSGEIVPLRQAPLTNTARQMVIHTVICNLRSPLIWSSA
jgi:hypothetical protein